MDRRRRGASHHRKLPPRAQTTARPGPRNPIADPPHTPTQPPDIAAYQAPATAPAAPRDGSRCTRAARAQAYVSPHESQRLQLSNADAVRRVVAAIAAHCAPAHNWDVRRHDLKRRVRAPSAPLSAWPPYSTVRFCACCCVWHKLSV